MAENLLEWLDCLEDNKAARAEIVFAVNTFCGEQLSYSTTSIDLAFLPRKKVIDALHKVYEAWGTKAALALAQKFEGTTKNEMRSNLPTK